MEFEFDRSKSDSNREKHGIDFVEAQILWDDAKHIIAPAFSITEERFALIGSCLGKVWTCVFTIRGENVRIISVRRARHGEKEGYYHR